MKEDKLINDEFDKLVNHASFKMKLNEIRLRQKYQKRQQNAKVTVIMPTWNRAFIIQRSIDSVLQQSYKNFELIISDDGSSDNTEAVINKRYGNEPRINYKKNEHYGVSHARNVALRQAQGDLIAYLDSDNVWSKDYLLLMVNTFVDFPEINTLYCGIRCIDQVNKSDYILFRQYERKELLERNFIDMNIFMHRTALFEKLHGFNEEYNVLEDWEFIIRYTQDNFPKALECCLATYYRQTDLNNLTLTEDLYDTFINNSRKIRQLHTA